MPGVGQYEGLGRTPTPPLSGGLSACHDQAIRQHRVEVTADCSGSKTQDCGQLGRCDWPLGADGPGHPTPGPVLNIGRDGRGGCRPCCPRRDIHNTSVP